MKDRIRILITALAVFTFISGAGILAFAAPGDENDPFITLSYLNDTFRPKIINELKTTEQNLTDKFNAQVDMMQSQLQSSGGTAPSEPGSLEKFSVVTLNKGQSLTCSVGTEIMLRIGTATGFGSAPALVNYTSGDTLSSGADLKTNNMYLITIEGNGVTATAATVRVLVRGAYKVS